MYISNIKNCEKFCLNSVRKKTKTDIYICLLYPISLFDCRITVYN